MFIAVASLIEGGWRKGYGQKSKKPDQGMRRKGVLTGLMSNKQACVILRGSYYDGSFLCYCYVNSLLHKKKTVFRVLIYACLCN